MNNLFIYIFGTILIIAFSAVAFGIDSGSSELHPKNKSGVKALVKFLQRADGFISIEGEAAGLNPNRTYISKFYDEKFVSKGSNTCLPSISARSIGIGTWVVDPTGKGTLTAEVVGKELEDQEAISIQLASTNEMQACGRINIIP